MTNPEERERRKYRWQQFEHQLRIANRISFWLPIAFFGGILLLTALFANTRRHRV